MRVLTVDQGNTLLKLSLFEDGASAASLSVPTSLPEEALPVVESWRPDGGIFCSVGHFDTRFIETLRHLVDDRLLVLTHHTPLPIALEYEHPETLGVDRIAAAAGAAYIFPHETCLVADCGSAVTTDLVEKGKIFRGGRISPGLMMRAGMLHEFTARLPLISPQGDTPVVGYSTETSLRSGIVRGLSAELVGVLADFNTRKEVSLMVLTGGDARFLEPFVFDSLRCLLPGKRLEIVDNLLNLGLLSIFEHNLKLARI